MPCDGKKVDRKTSKCHFVKSALSWILLSLSVNKMVVGLDVQIRSVPFAVHGLWRADM